MVCPACGDARLRASGQATAPDGARRFRLLACAACGSAAIAEPASADAVATLYAPRREAGGIVARARHLVLLERLRFVRGVRGRRALELGAGDGSFLALLNERGWSVTGVEPFRALAASASRVGVVVERATVEDAVLEEEAYDLVVFWHVLEHLRDPAAALRAARTWIAPEGMLLVAVPNRASVQAAIGGDRWFHQDVPRHLVHFTPTGLERLLRRSGFEIRRRFRLVLDQNVFGMWQTLLNRLTRERDVAYRLLRSGARGERPSTLDAVVTAAAAVPALALAAAAEPLAGRLGRGGTIVVAAVPTEHCRG